jgi:glycosyltransferase involved in cell wall biosynthesis
MLIWLFKDGENLPCQDGARPLRTWMLANALVARGHRVCWWSSSFSHQRKKLLYSHDIEMNVAPGFVLKLLAAGEYRRNISLSRYLHHLRLARRFRSVARTMEPPNVIVTALPIPEWCAEAVEYGVPRGVPVLIDIRDPWPDAFVAKLPEALRQFARRLLWSKYQLTRRTLAAATGLVAVSQGYLRWGLACAGRLLSEHDRVVYIGYPDQPDSAKELPPHLSQIAHVIRGKLVFAFVGSFGRSYELTLVCKVAQKCVQAGFRDIHFVIAGDGEQALTLRSFAKESRNVTLTGWLQQSEIRWLLNRSDVGLIPMRMLADTVPNKLFEYMSAGLPVISSLEGEAAELIAGHRFGCSYRAGDIDGLYRHVLTLAQDDGLRKDFGHNSQLAFQERFSDRVVYEQYADQIERICRNVSSSR